MGNGHGGARPGAGRKRKSDKYGSQITAAEDRIAARLDQWLNNLEFLADGGFEEVKETWQPAGLVYVELPWINPATGLPAVDANGRPILIKQRAFPDLEPTEKVLVERAVMVSAPDRTANIYLIDRILGKPVAAIEAEVGVSTPDLTAEVRAASEREMQAWRKQMTEQLSSTTSAALTPLISPTST